MDMAMAGLRTAGDEIVDEALTSSWERVMVKRRLSCS